MEKGDKKSEILKDLGVYLWSEERKLFPALKVIPTGSKFLDKALGIGGWPIGKIVEIFGSDSSGKTTLALHAVAEMQKTNKDVVYLDLENTFNSNWAKKIGVNLDNLLISKPSSGEQTFEILNKLVTHENIGLIVVDSVAALVPSYEFENNIEDQTMGLHARLMSKGLRILQSIMTKSETTIIFINQIREKIGNSYIPTTVTTGGRALKYAASVRVEIKKCETLRDSDNEAVGFVTKCIVVKNKFGSPLTNAMTAIYFDSGFDACHEIIQESINKKLIIKKGAWFSYKEKNIAQGMNQLRKKIKSQPELFKELEEQCFNSETK